MAAALGTEEWEETLRRVARDTLSDFTVTLRDSATLRKKDMKQPVQSFNHISWDKNRMGRE